MDWESCAWAELIESEDYGTEEILNEGGAYHLKSALKHPKDLMEDWIFKKEFNRMSKCTGILYEEHIQPYQLTDFIREYRTDNRFQHDNLVNNMDNMGLLDINIDRVMEYASEETKTLDKKSEIIKRMHQKVKHVFSHTSNHMVKHLQEITRVLQFVLILINNLKIIRQRQVEEFPDYSSISVINGCLRIQIYDDLLLYATPDQVMVVHGNGQFWIPLSYFLNTCDKIQELYNILMYTVLMEEAGLPYVPNMYNILSIYRWGTRVLKELGNRGFNVIASYEAICVGAILERDPETIIENPKNFVKSVIDDLGDLKEYGESLLDMLEYLPVEMISDLHGLYRIWGHPVIDIDGGLEKLRSVSMKKKVIDNELSVLTGYMFKQIVYKNYYNKNGFYPNHELSRDPTDMKNTSYLEHCLHNNIHIDTSSVQYDLEDWKYVKSKKNFEIPVNWNIIQCAKDKAISPTRTEIYEMLVTKGSLFNPNYRRGILKLMNTKPFKLRHFLTNLQFYLTVIHLIIGMYPKERELKILARFFALMSFRLRLYFTSTEELLSEKLLPLFPQITMCLNLLELHKKMADLSTRTGVEGKSITFVINIDFSKWNSNMRKETCEYVFREIDDMFDIPDLYNNTHSYLEKSVLYLSSGERTIYPDPITGAAVDGKSVWCNDPSGKEGLRQKGWTIVTAVDIELVGRNHDCEAELIGGGDNQVIVVTFRSSHVDQEGQLTNEGKENIRKKLSNYMNDLASHFDKRGLPLKIMETWISCQLFMYNKMMYYKGAPMRSVLKQVSRCFPFSNDSLMTVSTMVGTMMTNMKSAMMREYIPHGIVSFKWLQIDWVVRLVKEIHPLCYVLYGGLREAQYIEETCHNPSRKLVVESDQQNLYENLLGTIGLYPSVLGGPGVMTVAGLIMRGFPDPLCEWHATLIEMYHSCSLSAEVRRQVESALTLSFSKEVNYSKLIEDPYSISHGAPTHGTNSLRTKSRESLRNMNEVENTAFTDLLSLLDPLKEKEFSDALCSGQKIDPRVLHEIKKASLYGIVNGLASRVDQTKTIRKINETLDVVQEMAKDEWRYMNYMATRQLCGQDMSLVGCSTPIAQKARDLSWRKEILGCTVPHPVHYLDFVMFTNLSSGLSQGIVLRTQKTDREALVSTPGTQTPYFGSYTREKFKMTEIAAAYGDEPILGRSLRLLKLINWRYPDGTVWAKLLKTPLSTISNIDPDTMLLSVEEIKGDFAHRFAGDTKTHGGIPNFLVTSSSHMSVSTSTWTKHSRGGINENIHFQACIITCIMKSLSVLISDRKIEDSTMLFREKCSDCIQVLKDPSPQETAPINVVSFPTLPNNPYTYCSIEDMQFDWEHIVKMSNTTKILTDTTESSTTMDQVAGTSLGYLLFITMTGSYNAMNPSFCLLLRGKRILKTVVTTMRMIYRLIKSIGLSSDFSVRNVTPLEILLLGEHLGFELDEIVGRQSEAKLEGGIKLAREDVEDWIDEGDICPEGTFVVNLCMPNVVLQCIIAQLWRSRQRMECLICLGEGKNIYHQGMTQSLKCMKVHCARCRNTPDYEKTIERVSVHPDVLAKAEEIGEIKSTVIKCYRPKIKKLVRDLEDPVRPQFELLSSLRDWRNARNLTEIFNTVIGTFSITHVVIPNNYFIFKAVIKDFSRSGAKGIEIVVRYDELSPKETKTVFEQLISSPVPAGIIVTLSNEPLEEYNALYVALPEEQDPSGIYLLGLSDIWRFEEHIGEKRIDRCYRIRSATRHNYGVIECSRVSYFETTTCGLIRSLVEGLTKSFSVDPAVLSIIDPSSCDEKRWMRFAFQTKEKALRICNRAMYLVSMRGVRYTAKRAWRKCRDTVMITYASLLSHSYLPLRIDVSKVRRMRLNAHQRTLEPVFHTGSECNPAFERMYQFFCEINKTLESRGKRVFRVSRDVVERGIQQGVVNDKYFCV